jgi:hypothetical protein
MQNRPLFGHDDLEQRKRGQEFMLKKNRVEFKGKWTYINAAGRS